MKCPHCLTDFHDVEKLFHIGTDPDVDWGYARCRCSACKRLIVRLFSVDEYYANSGQWGTELTSTLVRPKVAARAPLPDDVPAHYAADYNEACLVLADSPKASAALSRRCLQHLLREKAKVKKQDLAHEIQDVLDEGNLPSHIADSLDIIRNIGNFAAHPIKSRSSGEIVEIEPGEAEWNLDVLEMLFDFYFVAPGRTKARRDALNQKLADAGKPPLK
jgi:Domain of unknown function (DUF4145)